MSRSDVPTNLNVWNTLGKNHLPGHMGLEILSVKPDELHARMQVKKKCAPNGFKDQLHRHDP